MMPLAVWFSTPIFCVPRVQLRPISISDTIVLALSVRKPSIFEVGSVAAEELSAER
jgi:hypothetical protein